MATLHPNLNGIVYLRVYGVAKTGTEAASWSFEVSLGHVEDTVIGESLDWPYLRTLHNNNRWPGSYELPSISGFDPIAWAEESNSIPFMDETTPEEAALQIELLLAKGQYIVGTGVDIYSAWDHFLERAGWKPGELTAKVPRLPPEVWNERPINTCLAMEAVRQLSKGA